MYYGMQIINPITKDIIDNHVNLTSQELAVRRELAERNGWKTKIFGPFPSKWPE